jgi:hypothetical protein
MKMLIERLMKTGRNQALAAMALVLLGAVPAEQPKD